nr:hypothetical protein GCM10020093_008530 [Planobispora longispora]
MASRGEPDLSWAGSTQLGPDLAAAVREIRDRHEHVKVVGSLNLVQTLLREKLFDRLDLWVHPVTLGVGKKVFDGGAVPSNVTLLEPPAASPNGIVYLRYGLAEGTPAGESERARSRRRARRLKPSAHRRRDRRADRQEIRPGRQRSAGGPARTATASGRALRRAEGSPDPRRRRGDPAVAAFRGALRKIFANQVEEGRGRRGRPVVPDQVLHPGGGVAEADDAQVGEARCVRGRSRPTPRPCRTRSTMKSADDTSKGTSRRTPRPRRPRPTAPARHGRRGSR